MKRKLVWLTLTAPLVAQLLLLAYGCGHHTPPQPPAPPPSSPCAAVLCGPGTHCDTDTGMCVKDPEPPPVIPPEPPVTPPTTCTLALDGNRTMKAYLLYPRVVDSTPLITNAERCRAVGFGERISCPTAPDDNPQRHVCECELIGGDCIPDYEFVRDSGDLRWDYEVGDDGSLWKARIVGMGKGRIRSCYPNKEACSPWLELSF